MPPRHPSTPTTAASRAVLEPPTLPSWKEDGYYSNYDAEMPAMMDPQIEEHMPRPSLLAFRPSRMLRVSQQQHQNAVYKQQLLQAIARGSDDGGRSPVGTTRTSDASSDDWYQASESSSDAGYPSPVAQFNRDNRAVSTVDEDEEKVSNNSRLNRAGSLLAVMAMPASGPIPLLERMESEDDDNDIDTIICDPSRLPRTLIVDEDGFTLSRESVMVGAAQVPRGGVIKSGLLFKQGFGLRAGGWKVRFVVLTSSKMTFFREEHGRKRGEIDLSKCNAKSIEIMPRDSIFDGSQATMWRFAIRNKNRRVLFSAYNENEMKDWLRCLHVALAAQGAGFGRFTDFVTLLVTRSKTCFEMLKGESLAGKVGLELKSFEDSEFDGKIWHAQTPGSTLTPGLNICVQGTKHLATDRVVLHSAASGLYFDIAQLVFNVAHIFGTVKNLRELRSLCFLRGDLGGVDGGFFSGDEGGKSVLLRGFRGANKKNFVHGTVAERRLIAGKLVRTTDLEEEGGLISSVSAPELSRAIARQVRNLKASSQSDQDALDIVLNSSCDIKCDEKPESSKKTPPMRELSIAEQKRIALRQQENQLQVQLLRATQKLSRKYQQQLDHHRKVPASSKIHVLAQKWEQQGRQSPENAGAMSPAADNEQYKLYMASRFSSQTELDFYPRKIEPREPATDKHRRHSMHTKYGNALVKAKCSLRGPF
ncbi:hypothetical protein BBO99_00003595 [Phytophthora kernoviae]|uniref:PH domain-containing protein n=2 Tax=Phytophthora kernoviae TaxID=325452 RepID=A0A421GTC7_9STRA|nr:hypothetical protein G195_005941 [Phytophthora kernoviae 00238/432]KAG2523660.1 hypothetical protein JM16_003291 [Phytophthora kernoviae]KAG2529082.1 hypothetical protein JM18_002940 [Phytophthora kernoviae]RLN27328.1 hypothetical protein BBI17_003732 [Phytophthora kernoviae]RLN81569.1 hypothetical protein BBO99_00003595 [Phytophthora kernoviae]